MSNRILFYFEINVHRYKNSVEAGELTVIDKGNVRHVSIRAAKAWLTKLANAKKLFSCGEGWDGKERVYTGKDLRWRPWKIPHGCFKQKNGVEVVYSERYSERQFGELITSEDNPYGKSAEYTAYLRLCWRLSEDNES